ncbi:MAG: hypothetical protein HC904_15295 [Blastochloris sp.]|nr:hypothetical protein [Blastochloris sp.]
MGSSDVQMEVARGYLSLGLTSMTFQTLEEIPVNGKTPPECLLFRLELYQDCSRWEAMQELTERLVRIQPQEPQWWIYRARAERTLDGMERAGEILKEAETLFPLHGRLQLELACLASSMGRLDEACQRLARAVLLDPGLGDEAKEEPDLEPVWEQFFFAEFEPGWGRPEGGYRLSRKHEVETTDCTDEQG